MGTRPGKPPPRRFTVQEIEEIGNMLRDAADDITSASIKLEKAEIPDAYMHLTYLQNTLIPQVVKYASDAARDADDEVLAKKLKRKSRREKSVEKYQKTKTETAGAPAAKSRKTRG